MEQLKCRPRAVVNELSRFSPNLPDRTIEELRQILGRDDVIKLSFNESSYGPSPRAVAAMREAASTVNVYHDPEGKALRGKLANLYGVAPDMIFLANGADEVIALLAAAYLSPGDEAIIPSPTFGQYAFATKVMGGIPVHVPVRQDDMAVDLDAMTAAVTDQTKLIFLCNPNNPTGVMLPGSTLRKWLETIPDHIVVVLDEAYAEYVTREDFTSGLQLMEDFHNIVVARTFSKIYALPALRLGYGIGHPEIVEAVQRVRSTFNVNGMAHVAALAALDDPGFHQSVKAQNTAERESVTCQLQEMGMTVYPSQTNFLLADAHQDSQALCQKLANMGIIIRPAAGWGLPTHVRISLGNHEENERLLAALRDLR